MKCNGALLVVGHHLCLLLQSADDAVYGIEEVLLAYCLFVVTRSNKGSLIAYICYVGTGESRCLA